MLVQGTHDFASLEGYELARIATFFAEGEVVENLRSILIDERLNRFRDFLKIIGFVDERCRWRIPDLKLRHGRFSLRQSRVEILMPVPIEKIGQQREIGTKQGGSDLRRLQVVRVKGRTRQE